MLSSRNTCNATVPDFTQETKLDSINIAIIAISECGYCMTARALHLKIEVKRRLEKIHFLFQSILK